MELRSRSLHVAFLGLVLLAMVSGCAGSAASSTPGHSGPATGTGTATPAGPSVSSTPSESTVSSASAVSSGSASASLDENASPSGSAAPTPACLSGLDLTHVDTDLEDKLPCTIGGIDLERFSVPLSTYIAADTGGDRELYAPWLVQFGLSTQDVNMAVVADLTQQEDFVIHAISVPGVADGTLVSSFADQARKAGWPVDSVKIASESLTEIIDPATREAGGVATGYVFASDHVLYTIITDDPNLLLEAIAKLP